MPPGTVGPPFDQFLATADAVAQARPEADLEMVREVFHEAATLLHDGLARDGLDGDDARAVVAGLCVDLVAEGPGAAVRARSQTAIKGSTQYLGASRRPRPAPLPAPVKVDRSEIPMDAARYAGRGITRSVTS
jgi:hypothetical protein